MSFDSHLPEYGSLEIENLQEFLIKSKQRFEERFHCKEHKTKDKLDFKKLVSVQTIGVGSFGTVLLMKNSDEEFYAVKAINKKMLVKTRQIDHVLNEKKILKVMNFPFVVHLVQFYSDNSYLYFILPFVAGGDMFCLLKKQGKFDEGLARFYSSQVVLALEYLHFLDIIYRDLKPENVLLDHTGYVKLTDFGFGKCLKTRTWTLCGTPEYLAPEVVQNKGYCQSVDWWALGVFLFEMIAGRSPFFARDPLRVYEKILSNRYVFPPNISSDCKSIIKHLLQPDISQRFGSLKNGVQDIKDHLWFRPIEWLTVLNRKMEPPFIPETGHPGEHFGNYKEVSLTVSNTQMFVKEFEQF